ncbi:MAG: DoxX family protein [Patescibacteria group bacterium]|nr:DoxX family protein [Patescibacteria group bacterium]
MWSKLKNCDCAGALAAWAPLVLRVALGVIFLWHGYDKVFSTGIAGVSGFLGSLGFPIPTLFAYILAYGELIAGVLLILGLFTHWAAKFATIVAVVAFFTVHMKNGFSAAQGGYEYIMLIFAASVSVLIAGAGKYSLDEMWCKKKENSPMA